MNNHVSKSVIDLETYVIEELKGIDLVTNKFNPHLILYICN